MLPELSEFSLLQQIPGASLLRCQMWLLNVKICPLNQIKSREKSPFESGYGDLEPTCICNQLVWSPLLSSFLSVPWGGRGASGEAFLTPSQQTNLYMWTLLIFHVPRTHLSTVSHLQTGDATQMDWNEIFHTFWRCVLAVYYGGHLATLSLAVRLISLRLKLKCLSGTPARGRVLTVCLWFKHGPWLIFSRQKQRHETQRETEKEGGGAEQDSPVFLSSLVSDCMDSGHHTAAAAAAVLRILGSPMSGSLKIMCAINKQTEAITGRQRRGEGLD